MNTSIYLSIIGLVLSLFPITMFILRVRKRIKLIQPVPVIRDELGYWYHPDEPDFDEDMEAYKTWLKKHGLVTEYRYLEWEDSDHPAVKRYWSDDLDNSVDIRDWNPIPPVGDGWFTLLISDTEDGPIWVWARRVPAEVKHAD